MTTGHPPAPHSLSRQTLNAWVDAVAFSLFVFLTATGVLLDYVLPPASGRWVTIWGMDRHAWGRIHFWIAMLFLSSLAAHVVLHRRWIACVLRGRPREGSGFRVALGILGLLSVLAVALAPVLAPVERATGRSGPPGDVAGRSIDDSIRGATTLRELETLTGVASTDVIADLGLPADIPLDEGIGKLGRQYGFRLADVRRILRERQRAGRQ